MSTESNLPPDHDERMIRAKLSLAGLSIGDAFGELFFRDPDQIMWMMESRSLPKGPWHFTDDTVMSVSIVEQLQLNGRIVQDELASAFAQRFANDPWRGYGEMAHIILRSISNGKDWRELSSGAFNGTGSMGNGGAMRVAPLGAYFSNDARAIVEQARLSADVTHSHPEGQAGAIAVALAAAFAWNSKDSLNKKSGAEMFAFVLEYTPRGETRDGIEKARELSRTVSIPVAAGRLGNGSRVISQDTVPFCLWCAARHLDNYVDAMWTTVAGLGDRDTTCAIVGGIVALSAGENSIPSEWDSAREPLK